mmetsp:Transcript_113/g.869  ORF Transcript_113/g.869 Transcript_113/m.869 type:complete len:117 (-) Transcript_113:950-1300(-)
MQKASQAKPALACVRPSEDKCRRRRFLVRSDGPGPSTKEALRVPRVGASGDPSSIPRTQHTGPGQQDAGPMHCISLDGEYTVERAKATSGGRNNGGMEVHQLTRHTDRRREDIKEA